MRSAGAAYLMRDQPEVGEHDMLNWAVLVAMFLALSGGCKKPASSAPPPVPPAVKQSYSAKNDRTYVTSPEVEKALPDRIVHVSLSYSFSGTIAASAPSSYDLTIESNPSGKGVDKETVPISIKGNGSELIPPRDEAVVQFLEGRRYYTLSVSPGLAATIMERPPVSVSVHDIKITLTAQDLQKLSMVLVP